MIDHQLNSQAAEIYHHKMEMLKDIEFHNKCHPELEYDPNYKEKFLKSLESID